MVNGLINILCYYVEDESKYPFKLFLLKKEGDKFVLPSVVRNKDTVINYVKDYCCTIEDLNMTNEYALVRVEKGDNKQYYLDHCFALPSEIINTNKIGNTEIDDGVVRLFTENPQLALIMDEKSGRPYIIPDAVYTRKLSNFNLVFGNGRTKEYEGCGEYYYFYRDLDLLGKGKGGDWMRHALFVEGQNYITDEKLLTDEMLEEMEEPTLAICFPTDKPNMLVKSSDHFILISFRL